MAIAKVLVFLFLCHLLLLNSAYSKCQKAFHCGGLLLEFPFSNAENPGCGPIMVHGCDSGHPRILADSVDPKVNYTILKNISTNKFLVHDPVLEYRIDNRRCTTFRNVSLPLSPFVSFSFSFSHNLTVFTCYYTHSDERIKEHFRHYKNTSCGISTVYYKNPTSNDSSIGETSIPPTCGEIQLPIKPNQYSGELYDLLSAEFTLEFNVSERCSKCFHDGGQCFSDNRTGFYCKKENGRLKLIILGVCGAVVLSLCILITYIVWKRKKMIKRGYLRSRNMSLDHFSKSDMESGGFCFGIPIFSYKQLEEATNNFDPSNELGDGGFGTVYYGKLRDGREVAIKRLYENNYRRVEQFMNEIKILTGLRHPNLVSLYGCTSRRSRELLLVYEYISNGTVADHIHGQRAKEAPLTWPVRMSIAIETATALAYLHNSDIIHRDVKTNNILLDSNFRVKVADFGLSRLFPLDVTHISTAPQGTPGYVDPEYYQCYQLTDKSDVYSFGVVLIELISSMPAVDTNRNRQEINLANLALNRIQRSAFDELIDLSLGYSSDAEVARMTTSVAELAFRCLQLDKDLRPSMEEVVAFLNDIHGGEDRDFEEIKKANGYQTAPGKILATPESDDIVLSKIKNFQSSPIAVTDGWPSSGSISSSIG